MKKLLVLLSLVTLTSSCFDKESRPLNLPEIPVDEPALSADLFGANLDLTFNYPAGTTAPWDAWFGLMSATLDAPDPGLPFTSAEADFLMGFDVLSSEDCFQVHEDLIQSWSLNEDNGDFELFLEFGDPEAQDEFGNAIHGVSTFVITGRIMKTYTRIPRRDGDGNIIYGQFEIVSSLYFENGSWIVTPADTCPAGAFAGGLVGDVAVNFPEGE